MHGSGSLTVREVDSRVRAVWQSQVAAAQRTPGLLPLMLRQRHVLLPRFAAAHRQLQTLPRRVRRHLQRHWRQSLAGLALSVVLGQGIVLADTINVDGTACTLINAIVTANTDSNTGGCVQLSVATAGVDTIVLRPNSVHTLTAVDNSTYGETGLPVISSEITIEGHGSTIHRDSGAPNFLILAVNSTGTPGDDVIVGTTGSDVIFGLDGNDIIKGGEGDDCIDGGPGNDQLEGQDGNDRLFGCGGDDEVRGGTGADLIVTGKGKDTAQGDEGNDLIYDTGGKNTLKGQDGDDVILAPGTRGTIDGGSGTDLCIGGTTQVNCP